MKIASLPFNSKVDGQPIDYQRLFKFCLYTKVWRGFC